MTVGEAMTDDMIALARRAVSCKGWRWMPGMRGTLSAGLTFRLGERDEGSVWWASTISGATFTVDMRHPSYTVTPDLTDPATLGCVLALVREAWGEVMISANATVDGWVVNAPLARNLACCDTEAEALVAALEAAP
jgi:hypothetical protein